MTERKSVTEEEKEREGKEKYLNVKKKENAYIVTSSFSISIQH